MSTWFLAATVVLYALTAIDLWIDGNRWMAAAFGGYAFSNVAFLGMLLSTK